MHFSIFIILINLCFLICSFLSDERTSLDYGTLNQLSKIYCWCNDISEPQTWASTEIQSPLGVSEAVDRQRVRMTFRTAALLGRFEVLRLNEQRFPSVLNTPLC